MTPRIAVLSDDLLSEILLLATEKSINDKFAVAQVSRHWRTVALDAPLLWSSFCLATHADHLLLPRILSLSSSCPLDIALHFHSQTSHELVVAELLARLAARIRGLDVRLVRGKTPQNLAPLLNADLHFPIMESLNVNVGPTNLRIASAPALRALSLALVQTDSTTLGQLLGPQLGTLELVLCSPLHASDLGAVCMRCPGLVRLLLRGARDTEPAFGLGEPTAKLRGSIAPGLRSLDLWLPCREMLEFLSRVFPHVPPEISARVSGSINTTDMVRLCHALLRGIDTLVAFELLSRRKLVLRDSQGRNLARARDPNYSLFRFA
ncbi:hypothetical protein AURDEDRAFT_167031 [Auricularia subglabra TFB-10046 SS5]|nr:hypothetical protein AURDEDRAFT_167031 [Auricularia subglabra TFB-10046 SS5]